MRVDVMLGQIETHAADVVETDVGIGLVGYRRSHPVGRQFDAIECL